jgi:predicted dehydrogenase
MKKARIAFIGAGKFIARYHFKTAAENPDTAEIRAIAEIDSQRAEYMASKAPVGYVTSDYKEVLADKDVDIVVVGTKQELHARLTVEALNAGKWVFCEKPMAETEEECQAVLEAEKNNPGMLAVGFNRRFAPSIQKMRELMQNAPKPWFINYRLMSPSPAKHSGEDYYSDKPHMLYEGCHIIDLVCWLIGSDPAKLYMTGDMHSNSAVLSFPDGSQVQFMCGSTGSWCMDKEYMELFSNYHAITISDFVDMRIRGFEGEFDRIYPLLKNYPYNSGVVEHGFDFYEELIGKLAYEMEDEVYSRHMYRDKYGMIIERVKRPALGDVLPRQVNLFDEDIRGIPNDKGWKTSFKHFIECYVRGEKPQNADGRAGAVSSDIALALLDSMEKGQAVEFNTEL